MWLRPGVVLRFRGFLHHGDVGTRGDPIAVTVGLYRERDFARPIAGGTIDIVTDRGMGEEYLRGVLEVLAAARTAEIATSPVAAVRTKPRRVVVLLIGRLHSLHPHGLGPGLHGPPAGG